MLLIKVLIILLLIMIVLSLWGLFKRYILHSVREGLEPMAETTSASKTYTDPGLNNDPLYLAKLNAANISYLKEQVDKLNGLKEQVSTLSSQTENNSTAITGIGEQMNTTSQQLTGRDPKSTEPLPSATGLD